ncbi:MAG TPA: MBL fold metallo-hydrolase [Solirubrobacteraceae bacterium]|nr:MBL fold metallo-hydrolase [Solirubrobacteraceae bacterium]
MPEDGVAFERAGASGDRIVFLGHATFLLELGGVRLLTDPLLRARVAHLRRQVPPIAEQVTGGVRAALVSHMHLDHLDLASLRLLGLDTPLIVPAGAEQWLRRRGFTDVRALGVGESGHVGAVGVTAVEARHDGRRHPGGVRAQTVGYLVRGASQDTSDATGDGTGAVGSAVYFAGDTELFEGMSDLGPGIDAALLPVAGWGSKLGAGHMDPLDAARAASLIKPRLAIPMHWGTLLPIGASRTRRARLRGPAELFARHVAELAPTVEVRILTPGEAVVLR